MTIEEKKKQVWDECIENCDVEDLVQMYNLYCEPYETITTDRDEFLNEYYKDQDPSDIIWDALRSDIDLYHKFWWIDSNNNIHSANDLEDLPFIVSELEDELFEASRCLKKIPAMRDYYDLIFFEDFEDCEDYETEEDEDEETEDEE